MATIRSSCRIPTEALDFPLGLPDDDHRYSLWKLRRKLLDTHIPEEDEHH